MSDIEDCQVDATRLREARETRGLTVSEAARQVTLSRAQVDQIENGGCSAFYSPRHKLLAVRKYASAFGLDPEEILAGAPAPVPATAPALPEPMAALADAPESEVGAGNEPLPAPPPQPASVALPAQADDVIEPADQRHAEPLITQPAQNSATLVMPTAAVMMRSLMLGLLAAGAAAIVFATIRGWVGGAEAGSVAAPAAPTTPAAFTEPVTRPVAPPVTMSATAGASVAQAEPPLPEASLSGPGAASGCGAAPDHPLPQWTPPYVRKASTRLYIGGPAGSRVCVSDSAGKVSQLVLVDGPMQAVDGRPPFVVRSAGLASLMMFMQGMKVKVPAQASAIRLLPGEGLSAPAELTADATPES